MAKNDDLIQLNRAHFDERSNEYDESIFVGWRNNRQQVEDILSLMAVSGPPAGRVLELGVGTGSLAARILEMFPSATLVGWDLSEGMLDQAREKLRPYGSRAELLRQDLATELPASQYEMIVSSNTVHHLPHKEQPRLFQRLYALLNPGGRIVIGDRVDPDTGALSEMYERLRRRDIEAQGLDMKEYDERMANHEHVGASMSGYPKYIQWMQKAGFANVDCVWKRLGMAIIYGERS